MRIDFKTKTIEVELNENVEDVMDVLDIIEYEKIKDFKFKTKIFKLDIPIGKDIVFKEKISSPFPPFNPNVTPYIPSTTIPNNSEWYPTYTLCKTNIDNK